jgi:hypothetical protein
MGQKQFTEWWMLPLENALGGEYPLLKTGLSALRTVGETASGRVQGDIGEWYRLVAFYGGLFTLDKILAHASHKTLAPATDRTIATGTRKPVKCRSRNRRGFAQLVTQLSMNNRRVSKSGSK